VPDSRQPLHLRALSNEPRWSCGIDEWNAAHVQRCAWRNGDSIRHRINRADVAGRDATPWEAPALPNGEPFASGMCSDNGARFVNDLTLTSRRTAFAQQAAVVAVGHEADLLALGLLCGDETTRTRYLAHFGLRHATQWETRPRDSGTVETVQEVRLVLLGVDSGTQSPGLPVSKDGTTRIVPGGNGITAKKRTPLTNECAELYRRVAPNTGARGLTTLIRRHKRLQDGIGELLFKILNVKRDAEVVGNASGIVGGIKGATAFAMSIALIGGAVQAHPHTDNLVARLN
jgi:hypothetical protein